MKQVNRRDIRNFLGIDTFPMSDVRAGVRDPLLFQDPTFLTFRIEFVFDNLYFDGGFSSAPYSFLFDETNIDSPINYLLRVNRPKHAAMIREFQNQLKKVSKEMPWYFQTIEGLEGYLGPVPKDNVSTVKELKITCLESINQQMQFLADLYVHGNSDVPYLRQLLPENMRQFDMNVYITEFRDLYEIEQRIHELNSEISDLTSEKANYYLKSLNELLTVKVIKLYGCEFVFDDYSSMATLTSARPEYVPFKFKIVGNSVLSNIQTYFGFFEWYMDFNNDTKTNNPMYQNKTLYGLEKYELNKIDNLRSFIIDPVSWKLDGTQLYNNKKRNNDMTSSISEVIESKTDSIFDKLGNVVGDEIERILDNQGRIAKGNFEKYLNKNKNQANRQLGIRIFDTGQFPPRVKSLKTKHITFSSDYLREFTQNRMSWKDFLPDINPSSADYKQFIEGQFAGFTLQVNEYFKNPSRKSVDLLKSEYQKVLQEIQLKIPGIKTNIDSFEKMANEFKIDIDELKHEIVENITDIQEIPLDINEYQEGPEDITLEENDYQKEVQDIDLEINDYMKGPNDIDLEINEYLKGPNNIDLEINEYLEGPNDIDLEINEYLKTPENIKLDANDYLKTPENIKLETNDYLKNPSDIKLQENQYQTKPGKIDLKESGFQKSPQDIDLNKNDYQEEIGQLSLFGNDYLKEPQVKTIERETSDFKTEPDLKTTGNDSQIYTTKEPEDIDLDINDYKKEPEVKKVSR